MFANYYSYNIVRKSVAKPSSSSNAQNVPLSLPHLRRALATLTGDLSARDLFVDALSDEQVDKAKDSIRETDPALIGGGLRNATIAMPQCGVMPITTSGNRKSSNSYRMSTCMFACVYKIPNTDFV